MTFFNTKKSCFLILIFITSLIACESDSEDTASIPISRLEIIFESGNELDVDEEVSLSVVGYDQNNNIQAINEDLQWSTNNDRVGINQNGKIIGLSVGISIVTVRAGNVTSTLRVVVYDSSLKTEIFVSDAFNFELPPWKILRYDENGQNGKVFTSEELGWPQDIVILEDQQLVIISNLNTNNITKYDLSTGEYEGVFAGGIDGPTRMKIGPDNLVYVLQSSGSGLVKRYQQDGTFVDDFTKIGVPQSLGMDWDSDGNLYVSSFVGRYVRMFSPEGEDLGIVINSNLSGPADIKFEDGGTILVNDREGNAVVRYSSNGSFLNNIVTSLNEPEGLAIFSNGDVLVANGGFGRVELYDYTGKFVKMLITRETISGEELWQPNAVKIRVYK